MNTSVLILAAGEQTRWADPNLGRTFQNGEWPVKQLVEVDGMPLIEKTVRQLGSLGWPCSIVTCYNEIHRVWFFHPSPKSKYICKTILDTEHLWAERTIFLLGDVYYSPQSLKKIINCDKEFAVLGTLPDNKEDWEIFGMVCTNKNLLKQACQKALSNALKGDRGKLWEVYRAVANIRYPKNDFRYFIEIGDGITRDFDHQSEYMDWLEKKAVNIEKFS